MNEFLTPSGLAEKLVKKTGVSPEIAKNFSTVFFSIVRRELKTQDSFSVYNFGTFKRIWIEDSKVINPHTGMPMDIPAHYRIKFVPSASVARRINRPYAHLKPKVINEKEPAFRQMSSIPAPIESPERPQSVTEPEKDIFEDADEGQEEEESRKPFKIIAAAGLVLLLLVILVSALIKNCTAKSSISREKEAAAQPETVVQAADGGAAENQDLADSGFDGDILTVPHADNSTPPADGTDISYGLYTVPEGSCYHRIAEEKYGNRHLWPYIYSANSDLRPDPDLIAAENTIRIPEKPDLILNRGKISAAILEAYNGYLLMTEKEPVSSRNAERRRLAVRVLVSGELLYPGFIRENRANILPEYAEEAQNIAGSQFSGR